MQRQFRGRLAFGKPVAKNDAHVIRRRLPPLSPQITNLRGPRLIGESLEARKIRMVFETINKQYRRKELLKYKLND